jgi:hypothetical protein
LSSEELARVKVGQRTRQDISRALVGQDPVLRAAAAAFAGPAKSDLAVAEAVLGRPGEVMSPSARQISAPTVPGGPVKDALFGATYSTGIGAEASVQQRIGWQAGDRLVDGVLTEAQELGLTAHIARLPDPTGFYGALSAYAINDIVSQQLDQGGIRMQIDRTQARETLLAGAVALTGQGDREGAAMVHAFIRARDALGSGGAATLGALFADARALHED